MHKNEKNDLEHKVLRSVIDCIYEAICVVDEDGIVRIWNESAEKLYKVKYEDIIGKNIADVFPNAIVEHVRREKIVVENKQHLPRENSHILANARPLYVEKKFRGAVSTDRDFKEVLTLYSELEQANSKLVFLENEIKRYSGVFGNMIGVSPIILNRISMARQIAPTSTSTMITGDSGTGKEVFARAIHELSGRKGLFVPVNCSAIPNELFESEFFGYCSGAFTGANQKGKIGLFELADRGTIFLDEIGDMPLHMQAKLLRVLQEKEITKVGGANSIKIDARVISATNKNLNKMVKEGSFREDLFYRLNVIEIQLPSLKERFEDIPILINHFLKEFANKNGRCIKAIDIEAMKILLNYDWPGNIRELMNVVEHMVVISDTEKIYKSSIPNYILLSDKNTNLSLDNYPLDLNLAIKNLERETIQRALSMAKNNKSKASKLLNIPRATLYHKIQEYNINI